MAVASGVHSFWCCGPKFLPNARLERREHGRTNRLRAEPEGHHQQSACFVGNQLFYSLCQNLVGFTMPLLALALAMVDVEGPSWQFE